MKKAVIKFALLPAILLALQAFTIPENAPVLKGYDPESVRQRHAANTTGKIDGLWYYPDEHITLAIESIENERGFYRLVTVEAEDCAIDCGCVLGYMEESAEKGKLKLWLYSGITDDRLVRPIECVANIENGGSNITIDKPDVKIRMSMNIAQFLPSIFGRIRIYPRMEKPSVKPGFIKIEDKELETPIYF